MQTKRKSSTKKNSTKDAKPTCFPSEWFDEIPTPIFILDKSGKILYANESFCCLIHKKQKECLSVKPMDMMIEEEDNRKFLKDLLQVYRGIAIKRGVYKLTISKRSFKTLLDIAPVYGVSNKMVEYAVGIVLDHDAKKGLKRLRDLFK